MRSRPQTEACFFVIFDRMKIRGKNGIIVHNSFSHPLTAASGSLLQNGQSLLP
jgi:hypothetical protein